MPVNQVEETKKIEANKLKLSIIAITISLGMMTSAYATTGAEFLRQDSSPNAKVLMGGSALEQGSALVVVNPAGLLGEKDVSLSFTHFASFVETAYEQLEMLYPVNNKLSIGGRIFYDSTYNLVEIDEFGENAGAISNYDLIINPAVAIGLMNNLNVGVGLKLFQSVLADYSSLGAALDLGVQFRLKPVPLTVGLAAQNIGFMTAYDEQADQLPINLVLGAAYHWTVAAHQITLLGDVSTVIEAANVITPVFGLQYQYQHNAFVRAAYRIDDELGNLMLGAGVKWNTIGLDYSYQPYGELGDNHRISFSYYFNTIIPSAPITK